MHPQRTLVAVHAHPDDESITTGGILAKFSAEGIRTIVVTCTAGDAGPNQTAGASSLATMREAELTRALTILGVSRGFQLGFPDSGFPDTPHAGSFSQIALDQAADAIAEVLRDERPDVVVTYERDGGYGHPDHIRAHEATVLACRIAAPDASLYAVVFPRRVLDRFVELMAGCGVSVRSPALLGIDDIDAPDGFGTPDEVVVESVDVSAYTDVKLAAVSAHASQMGAGHVLMLMPDRVRHQMWQHEFFRLL